MRFLVVLACLVAVCAAGTLPNEVEQRLLELADQNGDIDLVVESQEGIDVAPQFIVSWQARRFIRKLQKQMECGWPQYGIPVLAPLRVNEFDLDFKKGIFETLNHVFRLKIAGLNDFKIQKFKLNVITSKITFDFLFKNIDTTAQKYDTDTLIDALRQLGLSVEYEGSGELLFDLVNLRIAGTLKYKLPMLWGSAKITSLKTTISLESVTSDITGFMGNTRLENIVVKGINGNQDAISETIENAIVPRVNKMLKGKDFWTLVDLILSSSDGESEDDPIVVDCDPSADPWA
ncbi:GD23933 [Drosophila simulans]|uniref:GD23933 n=1 Tax=Drosophila simulans TaxID=7240 RepID=B4Q579_DROSI|nr:GD23933 [Drosophila simulans]